MPVSITGALAALECKVSLRALTPPKLRGQRGREECMLLSSDSRRTRIDPPLWHGGIISSSAVLQIKLESVQRALVQDRVGIIIYFGHPKGRKRRRSSFYLFAYFLQDFALIYGTHKKRFANNEGDPN